MVCAANFIEIALVHVIVIDKFTRVHGMRIYGRKKVKQLHSFISNRDVNLNACRLLLLSVVKPTLQYGGEV